MSLSGINFSGLGTGIDTESIIKQLTQLSQRPIAALQKQKQQIQQRQTSINQISALASGLLSAASALDSFNSFSVVKAESADKTVATATVQPGAPAGSYTLQVNQLAQAHRIASSTQTSQTQAMGLSGQIVLNGRAINIAATDSLQTIAANINSAKVGINAAVISTAPDSFTLTLTSANTGASNAVNLSDTSGGTILQSLGLVGGTTSVRSPITNGAASLLFNDSATSIGTLIGLSAPQAGTIQINGTNIDIDFATDSLTAIVGKINSAGIPGVTASIVTAKDPASGASRQQLRITGDTSTPVFTDSNNILTNLGILQNSISRTLTEGRDASFLINGLAATRSSNTISDVVSGVTINLLKDTGSPTTTINIANDTETIRSNIETFVNRFNELVRTVKELTFFDTQTLQGGPLLGESSVINLMDTLTQIVTDQVSGLSGSTSVLAQIGITLETDNRLSINNTALENALNSRLGEVAKLFQAVGSATSSAVSYISSTEKTKPSTTAGYAVNITQLATQATLTAGTEKTANDNPNVETLTFTGGQFGAGGRTVFLSANSTLDDIISQINADSVVSQFIVASRLGNRLTLTARQYGSNFNFNVVSSQAAAGNNSGIGNVLLNATAQNVAGTINGEAATGNGQFLTGNAGNATTEGLQLRITSTVTGDLGTIVFTKGVANRVKTYAKEATDILSGTLTQVSNSLGEQVKEIGEQIQRLQERLKAEEVRLRTQFAEMERAVTRIRAAGAGLAGLSNMQQ